MEMETLHSKEKHTESTVWHHSYRHFVCVRYNRYARLPLAEIKHKQQLTKQLSCAPARAPWSKRAKLGSGRAAMQRPRALLIHLSKRSSSDPPHGPGRQTPREQRRHHRSPGRGSTPSQPDPRSPRLPRSPSTGYLAPAFSSGSRSYNDFFLFWLSALVNRPLIYF